MSQISAPGGITTITGDSGGSVLPDGSGNISLVGLNVIEVVGVPTSNQISVSLNNGTDGQLLIGGGALPIWANIVSAGGTILINNSANSINLESSGAVPIQFDTDVGAAVPVLGVLDIMGGTNVNTSGAGKVVTVNLGTDLTALSSITMDATGSVQTGTTSGDVITAQAYDVTAAAYETFATLTADATTPTMDLSDSVTKSGGYIYRAGGTDVPVADGGTGASTLTDHGVLVGSGTSAVTPLAVGTDGQVILGSTGADPVFATLASAGSTITFTPGAGTLNLEAGGAVAISAPTDAGTAIPAAGALTFAGGTNVATSGAGSTVTINFDGTLPVASGGTGAVTLTDHGVLLGSTTGAITPTAVGTNGQVLLGSTGADPVFGTVASSGSTIAFTLGAGTLNLETGSAVAISAPSDAGTATPSSGALTFTGGTNIATSGAGAAITINFDGTLPVASGGTGATTLTDHGMLVGSGAGVVTPLTVGTNGQVMLGSTGADPVFGTVASSGSTIAFTTGAGTLNLETGSAVAKSVTTGSGTATPSSGVLTIAGGTNIATSGAGSTATINFDGTLPVASGGTGIATATAYAVLCGGTTATGAYQSIASVGTADQVLTSNGAGALPTFQDAGGGGGGMPWSSQLAGTFTMAVNTGYIPSNSASKITATLPSTAAFGDVVAIAGECVGGWRIAQNASQIIHFGNTDTSTGTGGYLEFTNRYDSVELICVLANTEWTVRSSVGNITVV